MLCYINCIYIYFQRLYLYNIAQSKFTLTSTSTYQMLRNNSHTSKYKQKQQATLFISTKPKLIQSIHLTPEQSNNTSSSSISFNNNNNNIGHFTGCNNNKLSTPNFSFNLNLNSSKSNYNSYGNSNKSSSPSSFLSSASSNKNAASPGKQNLYFSFNPQNHAGFNYSKDSFNLNNNRKSMSKEKQICTEGFMKKDKKSSSILMCDNISTNYNNYMNQNCKFSLQSTIKSSTGSRAHSTQKNSLESSKQIGPKITQQENIKVYIRFKPTQQQEMQINLVNNQIVQIQYKSFVFDQLFHGSQQEELFQEIGRPIINKVFLGFNGTIFAYGQTGSGKTHTIFGQKNSQGLIPRAIKQIYQNKQCSIKLMKIKCSLVQIYKQQLIDLFAMNSKTLKLKQTKKEGVYVQNLKQMSSQNSDGLISIIYEALKNRRVGSTKINQKSSRSHTILTLKLQFDNYVSKLSLIDLAGSQKVRKSGVTGESLQQTKKINYSLSCLGNVINALTTRNNTDHIPFRDSKLTRILKDSLSGSFMTSIIVTCSMDQQSLNQTISSLKFAQRAKKVKLLPQNMIDKQNVKPKKGGQSIQYLHNVIKQLSQNLEQTKKQLSKYKDTNQNHQTQGHQKKQLKIEQTELLPSQRCQTEGDLSARLPIPSQRAHVSQMISKYADNRIGLLQSKRSSISSFNSYPKQTVLFNPNINNANINSNFNSNNEPQIFSLNVSNTMLQNNEHDMISPNMSGFDQNQNQEEIASQISFSFSMLNRDDFGGTSRQNSKRTQK